MQDIISFVCIAKIGTFFLTTGDAKSCIETFQTFFAALRLGRAAHHGTIGESTLLSFFLAALSFKVKIADGIFRKYSK